MSNSKHLALSLLSSRNFCTYNRFLSKKLSIYSAILLSDLMDRYEYHETREEITTYKKYEGEWFYYCVEKCTERTSLTKEQQSTAIKLLIKNNLIIQKNIGIPCRRHFQINFDEIIEFMKNSKNLSSSQESRQLESRNPASRKAGIPPANINEPYNEPHNETYCNSESECSGVKSESEERQSKTEYIDSTAHFESKRGKESITQSEIYSFLMRKNIDFEKSDVSYVLKAISSYNGVVYDIFKFIEGTIDKNLNNKNQRENKWKKKNKNNTDNDSKSKESTNGSKQSEKDTETPTSERLVSWGEISKLYTDG